eukprot:4213049-Amphidinium_carterae.1
MKDLSLLSDRFRRLSSSAPDAASLKAAVITAYKMFTAQRARGSTPAAQDKRPVSERSLRKPTMDVESIEVSSALTSSRNLSGSEMRSCFSEQAGCRVTPIQTTFGPLEPLCHDKFMPMALNVSNMRVSSLLRDLLVPQ